MPRKTSTNPRPSPRSGKARNPAKPDHKKGPKTEAGGPGDPDQVSSLLAKTLDLAEASVTLGLSLVERLGTSMQEQVLGKISQAGQSFMQAAMKGAPAASAAAGEPEPAGPATPAASPAAGFAGVTNRQPLFPGSPVRVSFSINNDAADATKKVSVKLEGLEGELTHERLAASALTVEPSRATIAEMDFEKFLVAGVVPINARSDAYLGWIVVTGDEQLRIPLRLVVTGRT
jgi:hypothetical protein